MSKQQRLHGLYAITRSDTTPTQLEQALAAGCKTIQYRAKAVHAQDRLQQAAELAALCHSAGALFIINDDPALAATCGADGVHLGCNDADIASARSLLGADAIIGTSCYNRLALAQQSVAAGADYVAFGRFFASNTKPDAVQADSSLLMEARRSLQVPIVAIGGITPENGASLIAAGADMLAVIEAVFGSEDIPAVCAQFQTLFKSLERT